MFGLAFIQNLGVTELVIIVVIVLLIFGPKALPKLGRSIGDGIREFRSATSRKMEENGDEPAEVQPRSALPGDTTSTPSATRKESDRVQ